MVAVHVSSSSRVALTDDGPASPGTHTHINYGDTDNADMMMSLVMTTMTNRTTTKTMNMTTCYVVDACRLY